VQLTAKRVAGGTARAVVINSGNANACTGEQGLKDAEKMSALVGHHLGLPEKEVLVSSTGVIGRYLPMDKVAAGIEAAARSLSVEGGEEAARAICTTDTFVKEFSLTVNAGGKPVRIGGMAKGADPAGLHHHRRRHRRRHLEAGAGAGRGQELPLHHHRRRLQHQ
jgi:glutamate N-acetyltransferase/amino-acid N-acetyltransferase